MSNSVSRSNLWWVETQTFGCLSVSHRNRAQTPGNDEAEHDAAAKRTGRVWNFQCAMSRAHIVARLYLGARLHCRAIDRCDVAELGAIRCNSVVPHLTGSREKRV